MSTPDPRLSRRDAERLLDAPAEQENALGRALTAASAPADARELRGEDAAADAFQAARLSPPPAARSGYVSPSRLGSRAAARAVVATGVVVVLTSGGFALASSTDLPGLPGLPGLPDLPGLPGQASDRASESVADAPRGVDGSVTSRDSGRSSDQGTGAPDRPGTTGPSGAPSSSGSPLGTPSETSGGPATPTPDVKGLCRAFQATDRTGGGGVLDSAAFSALAAEAGGADRIATYCVDLIGPPKQTGNPTDQPTPTTGSSPTKPTPTEPSPTKPTPTKPSPTKPSPTKPSPTTASPTTASPTTGRPTDQPAPGRPTDQPTAAPARPTELPTPDGAGGPGRADPDKGGGNQTSG